MVKRHKITEEEKVEIKRIRNRNKNENVEKRLKALLLHGEDKSRNEIALETGYAASYITALLRKFKTKGLAYIIGNNYPSNHRLLSFAQEEELLKPFMEKAEKGQILEVSEIQKAYEEAIGRELNSKGHIYEVLKRHGFRKVMPRSQHPNKACDEVIKTSKKITPPTRK